MTSLQREIRRVFGMRPAAASAATYSSRHALRELSELGYPGLFMLTVFLTPQGRVRWQREKRVLCPATCCVCGEHASSYLLIHHSSVLGSLELGKPVLADIPHCSLHSETGRASAIADVHDATQKYMSITIVVRNRTFLEGTLERCNNDGDYEPPWVVFPDKLPGSGWNQGIEEHWLRLAWLPFWESRSPEDRLSYLNRWSAPTEWARWLHAHANAVSGSTP